MSGPSLQEQEEAFEAYKQAKLKADETLSFADARDAGKAWVRFLRIFEAVTAEPIQQ
jgi:hypothetical protein